MLLYCCTYRMIANLLVGVDLGTTATKAGLYRLDGVCLAEARVEVRLHQPYPGAVEQDMEDFYRSAAEAVRGCLRESGADPARVAAVAFDSQMAGIGAVDGNFRPAVRFDSWLDMRCQPYIDELARNHGEQITSLSGCPPTCDHGPKMMWWRHERPGDYARIVKFVTPAGYVAGRVCATRAEDAFMDATFLHFTAAADAQLGEWSDTLCGVLGLEREKLPKIVEPWQVVGETDADTAAVFGLRSGTPVAAGCGDTAAGALGAGVVRPGMLLDSAGTAAVLACTTDRYVADTRHRALITMRSVIPGVWNPLGYVGGGGLALRWYREQFRCETVSYESLCAEAAAVAPGCDGLLFSPHLGGRICPASPEMRGAWTGFSWGHARGHFFRSILEAGAYEYRYYLDILRELLPSLPAMEARVIGGGAQSELWNQIKADVLGVPFRRVPRQEGATWGAAMVAGKAVGLIDDLAAHAMENCPLDEREFTPNGEHAAAYAALSARQRHWQDLLRREFDHHE